MKLIATLVAGLALLAIGAGTAAAASPDGHGAVFVLSNAAGSNAVLAYARADDGSLSPAGAYATGGAGTAAGLGSEGSLTLSENGRYLLAVNAGSNTVSAFAVDGTSLRLLDTVPSGGARPTSVTAVRGIVYVLNADSSSVAGFTLGAAGLAPLAGSTRTLPAGSIAPSQVQIDPHGKRLVVTERGSNTIDVFAIGRDGLLGAPVTSASVGSTPFGFDFDHHGNLLVSDANLGAGESGATSYAIADDGTLVAANGAVQNHQSAACWLVASKDGRFAFTANAGSGSVSSFGIAPGGALTLLGTTAIGVGSHPLDEAVSGNGRFLYVLADGSHAVAGYRIGADGALASAASLAGLPAGAAGIAAL